MPMDDGDLERLLTAGESDRVERKRELNRDTKEKIAEAICAFANDLPDHRKPGVIFVGVEDDGSCSRISVTDQLLTDISGIRDHGLIQPLPSLDVQVRKLGGCEMVVVIVHPSQAPPVRYKGRVCIRVGPRRATASGEDERRLNEKRRFHDQPFDIRPLDHVRVEDLDLSRFQREYLPHAVAPEVLEQNARDDRHKLASLKFASADGVPTVAGLLVLGIDPREVLPGAYVQFIRFEGTELDAPILDQKEIDGPLPDLLRQLDDVLKINIATVMEIGDGTTDRRHPDYPFAALQQLARNAILHRNYEGTNAPVRVYWFSDRIEIHNPGGPYGQVTRANFGRPGITDYRNPTLAEAMKTLGYIQRFGAGIAIARKELAANGNGAPEFTVEDNFVLVTIRRRP